MDLYLEVWRKHPHVTSPLPSHLTSINVPQPINPVGIAPPPPPPVIGTASSPPLNSKTGDPKYLTNTALPQPQPQQSSCNSTGGLPSSTSSGSGMGGLLNSLRVHQSQPPPPPTSILKPPPPAPPVSSQMSSSPKAKLCPSQSQQQQQNTTGSASWRIRFNIEVGRGTIV